MRKFLLVSITFITTILSSSAQKSLVTNDSTYFADFQGNLSLSVSHKHTYNSNCLDSIYITHYYSPTTEYKQISDYYPDAKLYHEINQTWDTSAQKYTNNSRLTFYYNASNQNFKTTNESWINDSWQPAYLYINTYNSIGKTDTVLSQYWDGSLQIYVNQYRSLYTYDSDGHESSFTLQSWDAGSNSWLLYQSITQTFNANGYLIDYTFGFVDFFTNEYGLILHNVYYPDSKGIVDSAYKVNYSNKDSTRFYYTYYSLSNKVEKQTAYSYQFSGAFNKGLINLYYYDSTGNTHTDSTVTKNFTSTPFDTTISIIGITEYSLNMYGQQTHYLSKYILNGVSKNNREDFIHYSTCSSLLPVTILNFTGQQKNNDALLQWQTSNELNTSYFNVQRSTDGKHFTTIGKILAFGNSSSTRSYTFTDRNINLLKNKEFYYRLAEIDNDGSIKYSETIRIDISSNKSYITLSPNPIQNIIYLSSSVSITNANVNITDINGIVLYKSCKDIQANVPLRIDASRFAKGIYVVTIQSQTAKEIYKIVK